MALSGRDGAGICPWEGVSWNNPVKTFDQNTTEGADLRELQVIAYYRVSAGKEDEVLDLLPRLAAATRTEPGNVFFSAYREAHNIRNVIVLERYASPEAFRAHRETVHFKELVIGQLLPRLDSRIIETCDVT
jgi:quinol monooxygenase YgiN